MNLPHILRSSPKKLFLFDAIGAIISSILLAVVLTSYESFFGIPKNTLYILAAIPIVYVVYDIISYRSNNTKLLLKGIAFLNVTYCFFSFILTSTHYETITLFGWLYIIGEVCIVLLLARFELTISKELN